MQNKLKGAVAAAAVAALATAGAATAAPPSAKAKAAGSSSVAYHGVQVAIDPATGRMRTPSAADRQALSEVIRRDQARAASMRSVAGQRPRTESEALSTLRINKKGRTSMAMQVPDSQFNYLTATRDADGKISIRHQGDDEATAPQEVTR